MKSFSNFLLEKKPLDITDDPKGGEKFLKNLRKKSVQNQLTLLLISIKHMLICFMEIKKYSNLLQIIIIL